MPEPDGASSVTFGCVDHQDIERAADIVAQHASCSAPANAGVPR
jgi:hypothetical protein